MAMDGDAAPPPTRYIFDTRRRIAHAIRELTAIQRSGRGSASRALARIRQQEAASRRAGCGPIVCLCETLNDYLALENHAARLRGAERRGSNPAVIAVLLDVCWAIQRYADAVEKTTAYLSRRERVPDSDSWFSRCVESRQTQSPTQENFHERFPES